jgi:murein DD-endopeptidase MepM/ murein hydrolase activator NlpD
MNWKQCLETKFSHRLIIILINKTVVCIIVGFLLLSACGKSKENFATPIPPTQAIATETPTPHPTISPSVTPTISLPTATLDPQALERPVFLSWPLPTYIGLARISQYPNSAWTWNYLGLNAGYECPPMFGYLLNVDSWPYWRDNIIPEVQDKAQADPHNFEMVECYSTSNGGPNGHEGTDIKAPAGTLVYAVADGLIQGWQDSGLYSMVVLKHCQHGTWDSNFQCVGGRQWYTTYMHIVPVQALLQENEAIQAGETLGTIYDQGENSHLHFEVGHDKRSYANFVNPWGADTAPWLGCLWLDQALCVNPQPAFKRLAVYNAGELLIEQGDGAQIKVQIAQKPKKILLWGERVAVLDDQGNLFVRDWKEPGASVTDDLSTWQKLAEDVLDFQIADKWIAILDQNHNLLAKENISDEELIPQASNVQAFSLADTRLGYLTDKGDLYVQAGTLKGDWKLLKQGVLAFQLVDNRIAFVDGQKNLYVNEGDVPSEFKLMASDIRVFEITNVRMGVIDAKGNLLVKEGNLRANWVLQAENVKSFQLADIRMFVFGNDGIFKYKDGSLYQGWDDLNYPASAQVVLNGEMPVVIVP